MSLGNTFLNLNLSKLDQADMGDAVTNRKESSANLMQPRVSVLKTQTRFLPPTYLNKISNSSISLYFIFSDQNLCKITVTLATELLPF